MSETRDPDFDAISEKDIFEEARDRLAICIEAESKNRPKARAAMRFREGDQFRHRLHRHRRMHHHCKRRHADHRHRRQIAAGVVAEFEHVRRNRQCSAGGEEERVTVSGGMCGKIPADAAAGTGPVVDDDLLAQLFG